MKSILTSFVFVCLIGCTSESVDLDVESLSGMQGDSLLAAVASDKAWEFSKANQLDSSLHYAHIGLKLAQRSRQYPIVAYCLSYMGNYYKWKEDYPQALRYLKQSLDYRLKYSSPRDVVSGYNNLALAYSLQERYDSAVFFFEEGMELAEEHNLTYMQGVLFNGMGTAKLNQGDFTKAAEWLLASVKLADPNSTSIAMRYQNLGTAYFQLDRPQLASDYFNRAKSSFLRAGDSLGVADLTVNEGILLLNKGAFHSAVEKLQDALDQSVRGGYSDNLIRIYHALGRAYYALGNTESAMESMQQAYTLANEKVRVRSQAVIGLDLVEIWLDAGDIPNASNMLQATKPLLNQENVTLYRGKWSALSARLYAAQGNFERAYAARKAYQRINDSLYSRMDQAKALMTENERVQHEKTLLQKENELQKTKIQRQQVENENRNLTIIVLVILFCGAVGYLLVRNRNMRIRAKILAEKKKSDEKVKELITGINQQMLETQIEANNETSFRIGQDLHDNLGSKLAVVQTSIEGIRKKVNSPEPLIAERFEKVEALLEESCDDLRGISHDLQDREMKQRSLEQEIEQFTSLISKSEEVNIHFKKKHMPTSLQRPVQKEIAAVARLLIENVLRHAEATLVTVYMRTTNRHFVLTVEDDGIGFNTKDPALQMGKGLKNAHTRAESLGGNFTVVSGIGKGTKATLRIPITAI